MKDYRRLIENIQARTNPENIVLEKGFRDELSSISYSDILKYVQLHPAKAGLIDNQ